MHELYNSSATSATHKLVLEFLIPRIMDADAKQGSADVQTQVRARNRGAVGGPPTRAGKDDDSSQPRNGGKWEPARASIPGKYKDAIDRLYMVREPGFFDIGEAADGVLLFDADRAPKDGETFHVLTHSRGIVPAVVIGTQKNPVPDYENNPYGFAVLKTDGRKLGLNPDEDFSRALLAVRGKKPPAKRIALISDVAGTYDSKRLVRMFRRGIPARDTINIGAILKIYFPAKDASYLFVGATSFDPRRYQIEGENAATSRSYMIRDESGDLTILDSTAPGMIYAAIDLKGAGIYALLVAKWGGPTADYQLMLFDGKKFLPGEKNLYTWLD